VSDRTKSVSEMSDEELQRELQRMRRARSEKPRRRDDDSPETKQILQFYANLECSPGTPLDEVRASYRRMMEKYHPSKHADDPEKYRAATELAGSLTRALQGIEAFLEK